MSSSNARKRSSPECSSSSGVKRSKMLCQYGKDCYRRNESHLLEFSHPHLEKLLEEQKDSSSINIPTNFKSSIDLTIVKDQLEILRKNNKSKTEDDVSSDEKKVIEIYKNKNMHEESETEKTKISTSSSTVVQVSKSSSQSTLASSSSCENPTKRAQAKYDIHDYCPVVAPKGQFASKLEKAAPYYIFYTTITRSPLTHFEPLSVTFQELLDESLGKLSSSIQINFMVDIMWLMAQYVFAGYRNKPLTILYGNDDDDLRTINKKIPTITPVKIKMQDAFGTHHTKMMMFHYEDGSMRVVVSTANLYEDDWNNRTQGLWISPRCPPLVDSDGCNSDEGNGPTDFKKELLNYLNSYKLPILQEWIGRVRRTDFSHINVFLVTSVPGTHRALDYEKYGHPKLASLLSKHCTIPLNLGFSLREWLIICQCSSIGSLGNNADAWFCGQIRSSLSRTSQKMLSGPPSISLVYPTFNNVKKSHDDLMGGGCLPYTREQHMKQTWLQNYLCQWKAESRHRNRAMPHIKTYCRISPDLSKMAWFHLTSANLSKAAWGHVPQSPIDKRIAIRSYEAGVLFLPKFVVKEDVFLLDTGNIEISEEDTKRYFPFPYDLPLTPYSKTDTPFFFNIFRE